MMYDDPIDLDVSLWYSWNVCVMRSYISKYKYESVWWYIDITVIIFVSLSYMMTYGIRMYCFDDPWHPQCMRLYIHIEKYNNGFINICVMGFGSSCMESTNPIQNIFYVKICFTPGTYAWWANIYQYKCENVWW